MALRSPPIPRPKLSDEIAGYLRDQIISGKLRPGQRIVLDAVARQLGVSRMPVRDAVLTLSHEGLTEVRPRRGVVVAPMSRQDLLDAYLVHAVVAGLVVERAVPNLSAAELTQLERLHDQMAQLGPENTVRLEQLNWEFHRTLNQASRSRKLAWLLRTLTRTVPHHFYHLIPNWAAIAHEHHGQLLAALQARDAALARACAERHVQTGGTMLVDYLERRGYWRSASDRHLAGQGDGHHPGTRPA